MRSRLFSPKWVATTWILPMASSTSAHKAPRRSRKGFSGSTGSGAAEFCGFAGQVFFDTGSGTIRAADLDGELELSTGSGDIEVQSVAGELTLVRTFRYDGLPAQDTLVFSVNHPRPAATNPLRTFWVP